MHVIPWKMMRQAVRTDGPEGDPDTTVHMSNRLFRLLMEAALARQPFDEKSYLVLHPDVGAAIDRGECRNAKSHFLSAGYYEGRDTGFIGFDEAWYLARYPDVSAAVKQGKRQSGFEHFKASGAREWRSPNEAAEADIARWRRALKPSEPAASPAPTSPPREPAPVHTLHRKPSAEPAPQARERYAQA